MKQQKINQLWAAARQEPPPTPAAEFAANVLRAVRRESAAPAIQPAELWEQLSRLFPRAGLAAAAVIILCVATDWGVTQAGWPEVTDAASQASASGLFNPEDL